MITGLLVGRLYSFVGVLIVSPLLWFVAAVALWPERPLWATLLEAAAVLLALHLGFLAGAAGRLRSARRARLERATPDLAPQNIGPHSVR